MFLKNAYCFSFKSGSFSINFPYFKYINYSSSNYLLLSIKCLFRKSIEDIHFKKQQICSMIYFQKIKFDLKKPNITDEFLGISKIPLK